MSTDIKSITNYSNNAISDSFTKAKKDPALIKTCEEFEAIFIKMMLKEMKSSVQKTDGFAGEMYDDMLTDKYAEILSKKAGFGLAESMYNQLTNLTKNL